MELLVRKVWNVLKGKKTYLFSLCAIVYGWYYKDANAVMVGLVGLGIRNGISTEIAKLAENKS